MAAEVIAGAARGPRPLAGLSLPHPLWIAAASFVLHLLLAANVPLVQDEAYYALWARHLAWDYYDHPPMIAWWIAAGEHLCGATPLGVRLLSVAAFAALSPIAALIARGSGGGARAERIAALLAAVMVLPAGLGFTATPDAPSTLFWALAALAVAGLRQAGSDRRRWAGLGLAVGLGILSKFTNLFFGLGLLGWLTLTPGGRAAWRGPGPWIALGITLAVLMPLALWNIAHDGLGLARQFGRLAVPARPASHLLGYLGICLATLTPPLIWWAIRGLILAPQARWLLWFVLPLPGYLLLHALHAAVQANWIVPIFPLIAVAAALGLTDRGPGMLALSALLPGALVALGLTLALWPGKPIFAGDNPANQTKGWSGLAAQIADQARAEGAVWIATQDYGTTGALAFALPDLPVYAVTDPQRYGFRGPFPARLCDAPGLLVSAGTAPDLAVTRFGWSGTARSLERMSRGARIRSYRLTPVRGLRNCSEG